LVLIPNKQLETPHHHIERLRYDDPRLDEDRTSIQLVEQPQEETVWAPRRAQTTNEQPKPLVKTVAPAQPAPTPAPRHAAPAARWPRPSAGSWVRVPPRPARPSPPLPGGRHARNPGPAVAVAVSPPPAARGARPAHQQRRPQIRQVKRPIRPAPAADAPTRVVVPTRQTPRPMVRAVQI